LSALATVAKLAPEGEEVRKIIIKLIREYKRVADVVAWRGRRLPVVLALKHLTAAAAEGLEEGAWAAVLPLSYVGRFEEEEEGEGGREGGVRKAWEEIWMEGCVALGKGGGNTARALGKELCAEVERGLRSSSWGGRRAALLALADLTEALGKGGLREHVFKILNDLFELVPGRLWEGKESVLKALVKVVGACPEVLREGGGEEGWLWWEEGKGGVFPPGLLRVEKEEEGMVVVGEEKEGGLEGGVVAEVPAVEGSEAAEQRDEEAFTRLVEEEGGGAEVSSASASSSSGSNAMEVVLLAEAAPTTSVAAVSSSSTSSSSTSSTSSSGSSKLSYRGLVRVLVEQCHRSHRDYRRAAVQCLMDLAVVFPQFNVLEMTQKTLIKMAGGVELVSGGAGGEGGREGGEVDHVLRAWAVEALGALFPQCVTTATAAATTAATAATAAATAEVCDLSAYNTQKEALGWLLPMLLSRVTFSVWSLRRALYKALRVIMQRIYVRPDATSSSSCSQEQQQQQQQQQLPPSLLTGAIVEKVISASLKGVEDAKYHQVREVAIDVLLSLIKRPEVEVRVALIPQSERMVQALDKVVTDSNPGVVRLAMEAKALLHGLGG